MSDEEKAILKANMFYRKFKELDDEAQQYRMRAIEALATVGYCDCSYSYYRKDKEGNCVVCGKKSRWGILK